MLPKSAERNEVLPNPSKVSSLMDVSPSAFIVMVDEKYDKISLSSGVSVGRNSKKFLPMLETFLGEWEFGSSAFLCRYMGLNEPLIHRHNSCNTALLVPTSLPPFRK